MIKRTRISNAVAAALLAVSTQVAFAVDEVEPNDTANTAQQLVVGTDGQVVIQGSIGVNEPGLPVIPDVDFYSFEGSAGNAITIDIDGGMKAPGQTGLHVDTAIGLFKAGATPGTWELLLQVDNVATIDEGSSTAGGGERDARIDEPPFALPADGTYVVGVISSPRIFTDNALVQGELQPPGFRTFPNGSYTLIISGVTPPAHVQYVNIDIKPGDRHAVTLLNPKQKRDIPIALLSRPAKDGVPAFNPFDAKIDTITFGRGGNENSLVRCLKERRDWNHDRMPDLVCLFDVPSAGFEEDDLIGKLKGETVSGVRFEAVGQLKVVAPRYKERDRIPNHHGKGHGRDDDRHDGKHDRR